MRPTPQLRFLTAVPDQFWGIPEDEVMEGDGRRPLQGISLVAEPCGLLWGSATCDRTQPPLKRAGAGCLKYFKFRLASSNKMS